MAFTPLDAAQLSVITAKYQRIMDAYDQAVTLVKDLIPIAEGNPIIGPVIIGTQQWSDLKDAVQAVDDEWASPT